MAFQNFVTVCYDSFDDSDDEETKTRLTGIDQNSSTDVRCIQYDLLEDQLLISQHFLDSGLFKRSQHQHFFCLFVCISCLVLIRMDLLLSQLEINQVWQAFFGKLYNSTLQKTKVKNLLSWQFALKMTTMKTPVDHYKLVYFIFFWLGIVCLIPKFLLMAGKFLLKK